MLHPSPHNPAPRGVWVAPVWAQSISLWSSKGAQCSRLSPCQVREQAAACSEGGARQIPSQRWQRAHPSAQSLQGGAPYMDLCLLWAGDYCDKVTGCVQGLLKVLEERGARLVSRPNLADISNIGLSWPAISPHFTAYPNLLFILHIN